jgi:hypothetical protein
MVPVEDEWPTGRTTGEDDWSKRERTREPTQLHGTSGSRDRPLARCDASRWAGTRRGRKRRRSCVLDLVDV